MRGYCNRVEKIPIPRQRRKEEQHRATLDESTALKSLAGTLNFLGMGTLPQASYVASFIQQKLGALKVYHLKEANTMTNELLKLEPVILFRKPNGWIQQAYFASFSDASFKINSTQTYGQSGIVDGLVMKIANGDHIYHILDWQSIKQRRVSYSSYGAEILACMEGDDKGSTSDYLSGGYSRITQSSIHCMLTRKGSLTLLL